MTRIHPLFIDCRTAALSFNATEEGCWHTAGFSEHKHITPKHEARAKDWARQFRELHEKRRKECE